MNTNQHKIYLYKIYLLQNKYKDLTNIIFSLLNHINFLDSNFLLESTKKNELLTELFYINKNINGIHNNYITNNINKTNETSDIINSKLNNILENTNELCFDLLIQPCELFVDEIPFKNEKIKVINIINMIGYINLESILSLNNVNIDKYSDDLKNLLLEINNFFIPLSFNTFNVNSIDNLEFYWRILTIYPNEDILELTRELWIRKDSNTYYKIEGVFDNDILSLKLKTSQINSHYLYDKKNKILKDVQSKDYDMNIIFTKQFIRYDYIGNIYCMSIPEYIIYLEKSYKLYLQLIKSSFINIMKNFINNGSKLHNLYYIIFLLLLGNDNNSEIASLLINLTKEKKINSINLYNLINRRLSLNMQLKIKKGSNNINNELEKIKLLTIDSIDYKKQILSVKNIPNSVKLLTLDKIDEIKSHNNEYYKQKTFIENIIKYPWSSNDIFLRELDNPNKIKLYLNELSSELNSLTYGHIEAKKILLQTIANWISNPLSSGRPIGIVGPPGVGKTFLAKSISKALKIPFAEITLGGQNDGELLHGHGYTYSGSQPGIIVKKMVEMGKDHCIIFFDELDKTSSKNGNSNEISNILIHLTDPNMNKSFQDRFFQGIDFPLDKVIMIFSYNDSEKIDPILLDRLTEIKIKAYTLEDKISIVRDFIIPEINFNINLKIEDAIIEYIINNYTSEAGTRDIKRNIEKIFLSLNLDVLIDKIQLDNYKLSIDEVNRILLKPKFDNNKIHMNPEIGIINGLYATTTGDGGIIPIQIFDNYIGNNFEIKLTGKQGDVMKESVNCALTCAMNYIENNKIKYKIKDFKKYFLDNFKLGFHVHAPATATPKDGPSAGCAFTCAFISRILKKKIKNEIAMTGEIELTGKVTKIGGLNFKLIGAKKAGIKIIYIPKENKDDLEEFIEKYPLVINDDFKVFYVEYLDEIINEILVN
jgi:endopeptidase La